LGGKLLSLTYRMQYLFHGLKFEDILGIMQLRLYAHLLILVSASSRSSSASSNFVSNFSFAGFGSSSPLMSSTSQETQTQKQQTRDGEWVGQLCERVERLLQFSREHELAAPTQVVHLQGALASLLRRPAHSNISPAQLLSQFLPDSLHVTNLVKRAGGEGGLALSHDTDGNKPVGEFYSLLPFPLHVTATLNFVRDPARLLILITFPDHTAQAFPVKLSELKPLGPMKYQLSADVPIRVGQREWTEASAISVQVATLVDVDVFHFDEYFVTLTDTIGSGGGGDEDASIAGSRGRRSVEWPQGGEGRRDDGRGNLVGMGMVRLCPPSEYYLWPKATNRNPKTSVML
jgi:hypothetical protein